MGRRSRTSDLDPPILGNAPSGGSHAGKADAAKAPRRDGQGQDPSTHDTQGRDRQAHAPKASKHATSAEPRDEYLPAKPRRRGKRLLVALAILLIGLAFAPQIVGRTPLLAKIVGWCSSELNGTLAVGGASLSWWSPPVAESIDLADSTGQSVVRASAVSCDRTLWQLATGPTQLGRIRIERPEIRMSILADGTTNLEQVLAKYLAAPASGARPDVALELADATLTVRDEATGRTWTIGELNGVAIVPAAADGAISIDAKASLAAGNTKRPLTLRGSLREILRAAAPTSYEGDLSATVEALPLDLVYACLRRFAPNYRIDGLLSGDIQARCNTADSEPAFAVAGRLGIYNLAVGGAAMLGDEIRLATVEMPLRLSAAGGRLTIEELQPACDLASFNVQGSLDGYRRLVSAGAADLLPILAQFEGRAVADVHLAKIAQSMPHLLRLHDDIVLTGGELKGGIVGDRDPQGARRWKADFAASGITARRGGATINWDQPLEATLEAYDTAGGPVVNRLGCRSEFLVVDGVNSARSFDLTAQYDLQKLAERLAQFVDLGGMQLRGGGTAQGAWVRETDGRFNFDATAAVSEFQMSLPGYPSWTERQLVVGVQAVGRAAGFAVTGLEQGALGVQSGDDVLTMRLSEPALDLSALTAVWPLRVEGRGELKTWLDRIRPFAGLPATLVAEGKAELAGTCRVRFPDDVEIVESRLTATPLRMAGYGLVVDEPNAVLTFAGRYRPERLEIREGLLQTPSIVAQSRGLVYASVPGKSPELSGLVGLRADVGKLARLAGGGAAPGLEWGGMIEGSGKIEPAGTAAAVSLDAQIKELTLAKAGQLIWREPQVRLVGSGVYEADHDTLSVDRLEVAGDALRLLLAGRVREMAAARVLQMNGEATYDLARLTPVMQGFLGPAVAFSGRQTQSFELNGPTFDPATGAVPWEKLAGTARLGWDRAMLYGFDIGQTAIDARLNQGVLSVNPLVVPVGTGRVRLAPALRLGPGAKELLCEPGILADHVAITPEMANQNLKYVVPILAECAEVGGAFSVVIDEMRIPLDHPDAGSIAGKLTVHAVDVGPGAITKELAAILGQPMKVGLTRESTVDFKMIQGRIYHQNLEFAFPGVVVRTNGSVGILDQSLSMTAEAVLSGERLTNLPIAQAAVQNTSFRLPIAGTLSRPAIDGRAFAEATRQNIQKAAEGAIQQGLNRGLERGLERLLGPSGALTPTTPR